MFLLQQKKKKWVLDEKITTKEKENYLGENSR